MEKAVYYAVSGGAEKQIPALAQSIISRRDVALVRSVVRQLLSDAHLRRHFVVAAKLLASIHDVIPDDQLGALALWLLPRCREVGDRLGGTSVVRPAWQAWKRIGARIPSEIAVRAVEVATTHSAWLAVPPEGRVIVDREDIVEAVTALCQQLPVNSLGSLANSTIPLATERVQDHDYSDVITLLIRIAELDNGETRSRIAEALYPAGKPVNRILAQVDHLFGKEALTAEQLNTFASKVAGEIRLQVQRVKPGEQPVRLPETLAVYGSPSGGGTSVTIGQGIGLAALERHRNRLTPDNLAEVIRAMLIPLQDPDNVPGNKQRLLLQLIDFADRADEAVSAEVFAVVEPMIAATASNAAPITRSAFSGFHGDPDDVRAAALACAAVYSKGNTESASLIGEMIEEAAIDPNPKIRRGAYAAAQRLPDLPADALLPLLMGLRDPDPATAVVAFAAFADRPEWKLTRPNWKLFLLAARSAADSPHTNLRWHAASAISERGDSAPSGLRREFAALLTRFQNDISFSVREAVQRSKARTEPPRS